MTIDFENMSEMYVGQGENISFACFEDDGTTALDLTGGSADLRIWRTGSTPFQITINTLTGVEGEDYDWTDRALGAGVFYIDIPSDTPIGLCRVRLRSTTAEGEIDVQKVDWFRLKA